MDNFDFRFGYGWFDTPLQSIYFCEAILNPRSGYLILHTCIINILGLLSKMKRGHCYYVNLSFYEFIRKVFTKARADPVVFRYPSSTENTPKKDIHRRRCVPVSCSVLTKFLGLLFLKLRYIIMNMRLKYTW